jgi:leader peptidase (prepilin peptidase) / N-methyltransferase
MAIYLTLFILGLLVGSFLSVIIYRETIDFKIKKLKGLSAWLPPWATGRSECDFCHAKLKWFENIPLLSFLIQGGKCRYCHKKIKTTYPLFELFTALEFVWLYWLIQKFSFFQQMEGFYSFLTLGFWIFVFSLSIVLSIIDFKKGILPDSLIFAGILVAVLRLLITGRYLFLLSGLGLFGFFLGLYLLTRGKGIGFGDVKLAFFIGVVLGWWQWVIVAIFIAFLTGAFVGVILIISQKKTMKSTLPFGPFLLGGMLIAKIFGEYIWLWYMQLM